MGEQHQSEVPIMFIGSFDSKSISPSEQVIPIDRIPNIKRSNGAYDEFSPLDYDVIEGKVVYKHEPYITINSNPYAQIDTAIDVLFDNHIYSIPEEVKETLEYYIHKHQDKFDPHSFLLHQQGRKIDHLYTFSTESGSLRVLSQILSSDDSPEIEEMKKFLSTRSIDKLAKQRSLQKWLKIKGVSSETLDTIALDVRTRLLQLREEGGIAQDINNRMLQHEMSHGLFSLSLYDGVYKYIQMINWELNQTDLPFDAADSPSSAFFLKLHRHTKELRGLDEAYAMLHEMIGTTVLSEQGTIHIPSFYRRIAGLLSNFKRDQESRELLPRTHIGHLTVNQTSDVLTSYDLGTLILLTKGSILDNKSDNIFDFSNGGDPLTPEKIIKLVQIFMADPELYFKDFNPAHMKKMIEKKALAGFRTSLDLFTDLNQLLIDTHQQLPSSSGVMLNSDVIGRYRNYLATIGRV